MRKRLICWGLAAWLLLLQACPGFAAATAADSGASEETPDAGTENDGSAQPDAASAPQVYVIFVPELTVTDIPDETQNASPSALPAASAPADADALPPSQEDAPDVAPIGGCIVGSDKNNGGPTGMNASSGVVEEDKNIGGIPTGQHPKAPSPPDTESDDGTSVIVSGPLAPSAPEPPLWPKGFGRKPIQSNPFTDLDQARYAKDATLWAVSNGITDGTTPTTFSPNVSCTHNHILAFLWRVCGSKKYDVTQSPFKDITDLSKIWIHVALWAEENGLRGANEDGNFDGGATCTRAEAMRYLWILSGSPTPKKTASFTDLPAEEEYALAISWAVEMEITGGRTPDAFAPQDGCSRANIVTFLYRAWNADAKPASV